MTSSVSEVALFARYREYGLENLLGCSLLDAEISAGLGFTD